LIPKACGGARNPSIPVVRETHRFQWCVKPSFQWCEERDLNPHGCPPDPKSGASTNFAILAHCRIKPADFTQPNKAGREAQAAQNTEKTWSGQSLLVKQRPKNNSRETVPNPSNS
jgi:hypothetical protein